jgi:hypothetical protein
MALVREDCQAGVQHLYEMCAPRRQAITLEQMPDKTCTALS